MSFTADLNSVAGLKSNQAATNKVAEFSTDKKAGQSLDMTDFLTLMVTSLQNQTIDSNVDTNQMMSQMVQMSVVSAVTSLTELLNEAVPMNYAASLVGKEVTVGQYVGEGANMKLEEIVGTVTGTGTLGGQQVIFLGDKSYYLTDVMAVGRLPEEPKNIDPDGDKTDKTDTDQKVDQTSGTDAAQNTEQNKNDSTQSSENTQPSGPVG